MGCDLCGKEMILVWDEHFGKLYQCACGNEHEVSYAIRDDQEVYVHWLQKTYE